MRKFYEVPAHLTQPILTGDTAGLPAKEEKIVVALRRDAVDRLGVNVKWSDGHCGRYVASSRGTCLHIKTLIAEA